jgi:23S rRNA pseudouridine1911/1915/1917 synthase
LEVNLLTGRFHQIRVQLAGMGCPIYGDMKYGSSIKNTNGKIFLHARELTLTHPVKKEEVVFSAPLPKDSLWQNFVQI